MLERKFKKWNTIIGWVIFFIALTTYTLTVAPTVSFWDCGEYIGASSKLGIAHPPGAPLYQMLGAFISLFAFGNNQNIALMTNMLSVISSAFTILFLFWTISIIANKITSIPVSYTHLTLPTTPYV